MDEKTLAALRGSIAKWQAIANGTGDDLGTANCPLCQMFNNSSTQDEEDFDTCVGCPVMERTGQDECGSTPYWDYYQAGAQMGKNSERALSAAQAELNFLISLLPEGQIP